MNRIKLMVIGLCVSMIGLSCGCANITKDKIEDAAAKHDTALVSADKRIASADAKLATIENPPAQVKDARGDLTGARTDIKTAQTEASKLKEMALGVEAQKEKIEKSFWSPRQKQLAAAVGVVIALVGLLIVMVRFGGWGGKLLAIPVLGTIIGMIMKIKPKTE